MKKINLDFIGEIVSSPDGMCSWMGTTISFWGKFKEKQSHVYRRFVREYLIEAIPLSEEKPSDEYYRCTAFQKIPDNYLYIDIIPKTAYISLEYALPVEEFLKIWYEVKGPKVPTQKDYDDWCLENAKQYFYDMRAEIYDSIRLKN